MIRTAMAAAFLLVGAPAAAPPEAQGSPLSESCRPAPPSRARVIDLSDRVVLAKVTRVTPDPVSAQPKGEPPLSRGVFELTPVQAVKGEPTRAPLVSRYDATLYPDLFGGAPCRWSPQPVEGDVWLVAASRDGEDCGGCDGRLDATHKLDYLAPEVWFDPSP